MSVDDLDLPVEPELDARLRETLSCVVMTVGDTAARRCVTTDAVFHSSRH